MGVCLRVGHPSGIHHATVSLQTLINRKLLDRMRWLDLDIWNQSEDCQELIQIPSTSKIREHIANDICGTNYYDHGMAAAATTLCFGYDAPTQYIASEIAKLMPASWTNFREVWCSIGQWTSLVVSGLVHC